MTNSASNGDSKVSRSDTLRKSLQTTSTSPCRTQVQPAASFLVCSLIFIEYEYQIPLRRKK